MNDLRLVYCNLICDKLSRKKTPEQYEKNKQYLATLISDAPFYDVVVEDSNRSCLHICSKTTNSILVYSGDTLIAKLGTSSRPDVLPLPDDPRVLLNSFSLEAYIAAAKEYL